MDRTAFEQRYRALRRRRSGLDFPDNLPVPADLIAAAADRPAATTARQPPAVALLQTFPRLKARALAEIRAARAARKGSTPKETTMRTLILVPAYGRDYTSKAAVAQDFYGNKDFLVAGGSYTNRSDLAAMGYREVNIRYGKLRKVTVLPVKKPSR